MARADVAAPATLFADEKENGADAVALGLIPRATKPAQAGKIGGSPLPFTV